MLSHVPVLLNRGAISYPELLQLIDTRYVNPGRGRWTLSPPTPTPAPATSPRSRSRNLTQPVLDRSHRFLRLWRQTCTARLTMWELDLLLPDTDPDPMVLDKQITDAALSDLSRADPAADAYRPGLAGAGLVVRGIDTVVDVDHGHGRRAAGADALRPAVPQPPGRRRGRLPGHPGQLIGAVADFVPGPAGRVPDPEDDLDLILADLGLAPTTPLTLDVLSKLHRTPCSPRASS